MKAVIIGAGSIGANKPNISFMGSETVTTMAHAIKLHPRVDLAGVVDTDEKARNVAENTWGIKAFKDLSELVAKGIKPDIVHIAVPTTNHLEVFNEVITILCPKAIILEKPAGVDLEETQKMAELVEIFSPKNNKTKVIVNYLRRYDPVIMKYINALKGGAYGEIYNASLRYTRGLKHDGCHAIDLFMQVFGSQYGVLEPIFYHGHKIIDRDVEDPTCAVSLFNGKIALLPVDGRSVSVFDIDFYTERALVSMVDHGKRVHVAPVATEKTYGKYDSYDYDSVHAERTQLSTRALINVVQSAFRLANGGDYLPNEATLEDAINVQRFYNT